MPAIAHAKALADAIGISAGPVASNYLDTWAIMQPAGDGRLLAIGQQIYHFVRLEVYQLRAVATAAPPRPIIDTENTRRGSHLIG